MTIKANLSTQKNNTGSRPQMLSKHLFHFAMVHDEFAKTGDIAKGLLPLFTPILSNKEGSDFSPENFCKEVNNAYGIDMHPYVAEDLAPKLAEAGILTSAGQIKNKIKYIINTIPAIDGEKIKNETADIFQGFETITKKLLQKAKFETQIDYSKEFTTRLARIDSFLDSHIYAPPHKNEVGDIIDYAFVRFVKIIEDKGGQLKEALNKVYSGAILAEVVLSIKEPSIDNNSISGKYFYIDAPILLNLLCLNDEYSAKCSQTLIKQIKENNGILTTTSSYIDEAQTAIKLALDNHQNRGSRSTSLDLYLFRGSDNLLNARTAQNKVKSILINSYDFNLDNNLINLRQHISSQRAESLKEKISNELSWYKNNLARDNDAEAVTNVIARHNYCSIKNMAESNSFLVTPNESLIFLSNKVLYSTQAFTKPDMTPLLSEKKLAMLLWVISGGKGENISSLTLISSCTRAMEMHKDVFYKIQNFIKRLPPEKSSLYEDIISNDRALYCLMDEVGSNFSLINESNFEDNLIKSREVFLAQEKAEKDQKNKEIDVLSKKIDKSEADKQKAHQALIEKTASDLEKNLINNDLKNQILGLQNEIQKINEESKIDKIDSQKKLTSSIIKEKNGKLSALKNIKNLATKEATRQHNNLRAALVFIAILYTAVNFYLIYKLSWDVMEPYSFVSAASIALFYSCYGIIHGKTLNPLELLNNIKTYTIEKEMKKNNLTDSEIKNIELEIQELTNEITSISK